MNFECDCQCEADYGVFGEITCTCGIVRSSRPDPARERQIEREREKRRRAFQRDMDFNSHLIELFNERRKHDHP